MLFCDYMSFNYEPGKDDGGNVETNLHGDEMDNVELDPEKERSLHRGLRKVNTKDRESVEAEI